MNPMEYSSAQFPSGGLPDDGEGFVILDLREQPRGVTLRGGRRGGGVRQAEWLDDLPDLAVRTPKHLR